MVDSTIPPILARRVCKRFGSVVALEDLSLQVETGEIVGVVGPDGAGKTTALRILAGIMSATEGEIRILGIDVVHHPEAIRGEVGYVPQATRTYADLTVWENLIFFADLYGVPPKLRLERIRELLAFSRLEPARDRLARNLSGGMRQKLALSCAVIHRPRVLFLDEPTAGVDPGSRRDLWGILYELLREGVAILVSTPYLDEAERCHRVALLHRGRIATLDSPRRLRADLPGRLVELRPPDPFAILPHIRSAPGVLDAQLFGESIHALIEEEDGERFRSHLVGLGLEGLPLRPIPPRLEDVFVFLLKR